MTKANRLLKSLLAVLLFAAFAGCAGTNKQESTGQYLDDSIITTKVKALVFNEPSLKVLQIQVETFKGEVQLSGFVDSTESVRKAGEIARSVAGVKSIKNSLIVK